jgi:hypothetical protein
MVHWSQPSLLHGKSWSAQGQHCGARSKLVALQLGRLTPEFFCAASMSASIATQTPLASARCATASLSFPHAVLLSPCCTAVPMLYCCRGLGLCAIVLLNPLTRLAARACRSWRSWRRRATTTARGTRRRRTSGAASSRRRALRPCRSRTSPPLRSSRRRACCLICCSSSSQHLSTNFELGTSLSAGISPSRCKAVVLLLHATRFKRRQGIFCGCRCGSSSSLCGK